MILAAVARGQKEVEYCKGLSWDKSYLIYQ